MEKICVAVRVRPPLQQESSFSSSIFNGSFWKIDDNRISLHKPHGTPISALSYAFDHVFDESITNARVYELLTKDIIHAAVEGFNGTAFAYGQTSSGKTYTMNGSESDPGIIHLAVRDIFEKIRMISDREFLIRVSYMEIYNEEINDLFAVQNQKLQIHESLERGVFVSGLREEIVDNAEQVLKLITSGEVNRHFGETNMNVHSSRSHTIFRMVIESKVKDIQSSSDYSNSDAIRVSVLNLVDLAGSERIAKTGADGVRLKEGKHINKSLMILGNVINKLSDGAKQRGHIPYRDSKLTRILQPALGGNAKTSIICTLAPEEVHVEETKGTLQFASRAKHITNCAQVNEILTDAALLKRQKLEIVELRIKLQGSHNEVLEQEILKLQNEMLKYELEHGKLSRELEEERRSQKERAQYIKDQQMKIENLSNLVTSSESDRCSEQGEDSVKRIIKEDCRFSNGTCHGDVFKTPSFKAGPNVFVAKRSNNSRFPDYSPLPEAFSNVADEDMWMKMNKGYITDLDSLLMTPGRKVQSFPSKDASPVKGCSHENYKQEIQNLRKQLEQSTKEKIELERKHTEQILLNTELMGEVSELQKEALRIREIPQRLCESLATCRATYEDVLSTIQGFAPDGKSATAKMLSCTSEIATSIFTTLEPHFSTTVDGKRSFTENDSLVQEQHRVLRERLNNTITSLVLSQTPTFVNKQLRNPIKSCGNKGFSIGGDIAGGKENVNNAVNTIKVEKELEISSQLLGVSSKERNDNFEREFQRSKEEREVLIQEASDFSDKISEMIEEKENVLKELKTEVQKRKDLEEEIKQFSVAFASRQRSLMSFYSQFKSKIDKLRIQNSAEVPKSLGY